VSLVQAVSFFDLLSRFFIDFKVLLLDNFISSVDGTLECNGDPKARVKHSRTSAMNEAAAVSLCGFIVKCYNFTAKIFVVGGGRLKNA